MIVPFSKRYFWLLSSVLWVLFVYPVSSYGSEKDLLSVDFSETNLQLLLLGTITRNGFGTAIIKNNVTGDLRTYAEGEAIDLIETERVKLVQIGNCMVLIQRKGKYETISCNTIPSADYSSIRSPLARYKIVDKSGKEIDKKMMYKPNTKKNQIRRVSAKKYEKQIQNASKKHGVDPYLVEAIINIESGFNPDAVSPKNAMGMMQLMPGTAEEYGVYDPFNPEANIDGGVRVLKDLMDYFNGNLELSLAAYNAGKGAVVKYGFKIPPYVETLDYVEKVLGQYSLLKWNRYE